MKASGSEQRQRSSLLSFRVSPEEEADLKIRADQSGYSMAAYVRLVALTKPGPRAQRRPPTQRVDCAKLLAAIGDVGSAVRDIAGRLGDEDAILRKEMSDIQNKVTEIRDHLVWHLRR